MAENGAAPWIATYGVLAVATTVSNLLFCLVYLNSDRLRRMRISLLLISLTAADLLVGAVAIPMYMVIVWPGSVETASSKALERPYKVIDVLSGFASLSGLTMIALERVHSMFRPLTHRSLSKTPYILASLFGWCVAALQLILFLLQWSSVLSPKQVFFCLFPWMTVPMVVILASYATMGAKIRRHRHDAWHYTRTERERKLAVTLAILTAIFLVTWLPFYALNVVVNLCIPCLENLSLHLIYAAKFLHYSNSLANPLVYSFRIPDVRRTLTRMLCGRRRMAVVPARIRVTTRKDKAEQSGTSGQRR